MARHVGDPVWSVVLVPQSHALTDETCPLSKPIVISSWPCSRPDAESYHTSRSTAATTCSKQELALPCVCSRAEPYSSVGHQASSTGIELHPLLDFIRRACISAARKYCPEVPSGSFPIVRGPGLTGDSMLTLSRGLRPISIMLVVCAHALSHAPSYYCVCALLAHLVYREATCVPCRFLFLTHRRMRPFDLRLLSHLTGIS